MSSWKTRSRKTIYSHPPWIEIEQHELQLPNGTEIQDWHWVKLPDFANVVVIDREGRFLCFQQTKYAVEGECLALVGGYLEEGEDPLAAAKREMLEEMGAVSTNWESLGTYAIDGNRGCGHAHLFLARDAEIIQEPDCDDLEDQEILSLSRAQMIDALKEECFPVIPWACAVGLALIR